MKCIYASSITKIASKICKILHDIVEEIGKTILSIIKKLMSC